MTKKRNLTIQDVADAAGVSKAAVSYALNGGGNLSQELRKNLIDMANKLGYNPNRSARAIRTGRTQTLGLVIPNLKNPFFPELAQSIEENARENNQAVILVDARGVIADEVTALNHLVDNGVDGIVWCRSTVTHVQEPKLSVPIVIIGANDGTHDSVQADDYLGGQLAAQLLCEKNHTKIAMVMGSEVPLSKNVRRTAFLERIKPPISIVWEETSLQSEPRLGKQLIDKLSAGGFSAVFCANDVLAIGVINALNHLGKSIPTDVAVVGFDDIPWCEVVWPSLTTIRQPFAAMGEAAIDLLLARLENPQKKIVSKKIAVSLITREST